MDADHFQMLVDTDNDLVIKKMDADGDADQILVVKKLDADGDADNNLVVKKLDAEGCLQFDISQVVKMLDICFWMLIVAAKKQLFKKVDANGC